MTLHPSRAVRRACAAALAGLLLAACGGGDGDDAAGGDRSGDLTSALQSGGSLTVWTWSTKFDTSVAAFHTAYPNVNVRIVNAGQSGEEYTALQNAVTAGSGGPDVAMVEYHAIPQLALGKILQPLGQWGLDSLRGQFTASSWSQVTRDGALYALPSNTGPLVQIYNKKLYDSLGLQPAKTWAEFAEQAEKIHAANPKGFITSLNPSDAGVVDSLIWQGGGRPFAFSGTTGTVNFADEGTTRVADYWTKLLSRRLISPQPGFTDEWWRALGDGTLATWISGAWALGNVQSTLPDNVGQFQVAPAPVWDAASPQNAENGGSGFSVIKGSKNAALAAAFVRWLNTDPTALAAQVAKGSFPAQTSTLTSSAYLDSPLPYYGGQKARHTLADAGKAVASGWQYLPYQVYANSVFGDAVGPAISRGTSISAGLQAWQQRIVSYGKQQGFDVK